jgi:hypothetical protein
VKGLGKEGNGFVVIANEEGDRADFLVHEVVGGECNAGAAGRQADEGKGDTPTPYTTRGQAERRGYKERDFGGYRKSILFGGRGGTGGV